MGILRFQLACVSGPGSGFVHASSGLETTASDIWIGPLAVLRASLDLRRPCVCETVTVGIPTGLWLLPTSSSYSKDSSTLVQVQVQVQENKHHISSLHNTRRQLPARSH